MPLLVPSVTAPPLPQPPPPVPEPTPDAGFPSVTVTTLTDPAGRIWYLSGGSDGIHVTPGRRGFHAAAYDLYEDVSPAVDGSFFRGVRAPAGELFQPLFFFGATRSDLTRLRRSFAAATSPKRGPCVLTVAQPDGDRRSIDVYRGAGMEGEEGEGDWGVTAMRYGLVLRALDPYWYGPDETHRWAGAASRTFFPLVHSPTNFVVLLASQVLGTTTVDNVGDVEAYPRWAVSGPATGITFTNSTTGRTLALTSALAGTANKRIIDTRPGAASVTDEAGANRWAELSAGSSLWTLQPGVNELSVAVTGSTSATLATLVYRPRFEGV